MCCPQGGFSGMFTVTGMPTELKVSYWIWLIGGLLGLLGGVIGLFGSFVLIAFAPAVGLLVLLLVLVALALAAAQIVLAMKMKEGREWARFALTIVAGISLVLAIISASVADGRGGGSWPGFIISLAADGAHVAAQLAGLVCRHPGPHLGLREAGSAGSWQRRGHRPPRPSASGSGVRIPLRNDPRRGRPAVRLN